MSIAPRLRAVLLIACVLFVWLASQREWAHRSVIDPSAPLHTSNVVEARGLLFPWLIVEVPPELGPVSLWARISLINLFILLGIALAGASALVAGALMARALWRNAWRR